MFRVTRAPHPTVPYPSSPCAFHGRLVRLLEKPSYRLPGVLVEVFGVLQAHFVCSHG